MPKWHQPDSESVSPQLPFSAKKKKKKKNRICTLLYAYAGILISSTRLLCRLQRENNVPAEHRSDEACRLLVCERLIKKEHFRLIVSKWTLTQLKFQSDESLQRFISYMFTLKIRFKSKYGCPISSKITKLYFILNIIQLSRGLKII